jgi:hypothetical protein
LRRVFARQLRGHEWRDVFRASVAELEAFALCRLRGALGGGLDVVNVVDVIHEQALRLHDDRDRLECGHVFEPHRDRRGWRDLVADDHVNLRLASEKPQDLADIVSLEFADANAAALGR